METENREEQPTAGSERAAASASPADEVTETSSTEPVPGTADEQQPEQGQPQARSTEQSDLEKTNQFLLNVLSEWQGSMKNMEVKMQKLEKEKEEQEKPYARPYQARGIHQL